MNVSAFHLIGALVRAIHHREEVEKAANYSVDSALLATWKQMLKAVREDKEQLVITD